MRNIIYEATGRAREFSELACNLFVGCEHGCVYCWSPMVTHKERNEFMHPEIRVTVLDMMKSSWQWAKIGKTRKILLSFTCDPYTPIEQETMLTRKCIMALHEAGLNVVILTKGGLRSTRDFDLLTSKDAYATTLTCLDDDDSRLWEPKAALPIERIEALQKAHDKGIETWVSFEPVLYPEQVKDLVVIVKDYVSHVKLGKLNYVSHLPPEFQKIVQGIDWYKFGWQMKDLMDSMGVTYYFKNDLLREMKVKPENFEQTWKC